MYARIVLLIFMAIATTGCLSSINVSSVDGVPYTKEMQVIEPSIPIEEHSIALQKPVSEVDFTGNGNLLIASGDSYAALVNPPDMQLKEFKAFSTTTRLSPDAKILAMGGYVEFTIRYTTHEVAKLTLFDTNTQKIIGSYEDEIKPILMQFSAKENTLAIANSENISLINPKNGRSVKTIKRNCTGPFAFSPDGRHIAFVKYTTGTPGEYTVCVYDLDTEKPIYERATSKWITSISFSTDAKLMAVATSEMRFTDHLGTVQVYETESGKEILKWQQEEAITKVAFSPDAKSLAIATATFSSTGLTRQGAVHVLAMSSQKEETTLRFDDPVGDLEFSPNNSLLSMIVGNINLGGNTGALFLYDLSEKKFGYRMDAKEFLSRTSFAPNGEYLAVGGIGETIHILKAKEGYRF